MLSVTSEDVITQGNTTGMEWQRSRMVMKPDNQLVLTEAELEEEIPRYLQSQNPLAFRNVVYFNYNQGEWINASTSCPTIHFIHCESYAVHKDSPEAHDPQFNFRLLGSGNAGRDSISTTIEKDMELEEHDIRASGDEEEKFSDNEEEDDEGFEGEEATVRASDDADRSDKKRPPKKIPNAFNFYEGASQAPDIPLEERTREVQTIVPGKDTLLMDFSPSIIYDAYAIDYALQQKEKEKKALILPQPGRKVKPIKKHETHEGDNIIVSLNIMDRVVCQNMYDEVTFDFRYYEDPSDEYREENVGTLLPLWRFTHTSVRSATVTDIEWNPKYYDLLAVSFGKYEYNAHPSPGALALFTLKNTTYPEWLVQSDAAILCISIHHERDHLVGVGQFDGTLAIYSTAQKVKQGVKNALYTSSPADINAPNTLAAIVQVKWAPHPDILSIFSIAKDGEVINWRATANGLIATTINQLNLPISDIIGPEGAILNILARTSTFTFHPNDHDCYLIGTEDGRFKKCSILQDEGAIYERKGHSMAITRISYNYFNEDVYLTCSFDWTVQIWLDSRQDPLFVFDLGHAVGDAQWAPYSSTVFAAIATNGTCHVFDLNVNKFRPVCVQQVVSRIGNNHATRLKFNNVNPILVIGDSRGTVIALKLSPNLRIPTKATKKEPFQPHELEVRKLQRIISYTKPPKLEPPPDKPCLG